MKRHTLSKVFTVLAGLCVVLLLFSACKRQPSGSQYRSWRKNKKGKNEVLRKAPANMVYIPSGKFIMGDLEGGTSADKNTMPRAEEVEAFYLDQTEVSNQAYIIYLTWLKKFGDDQLDFEFALPDTQCWRNPMTYNEPLVRNYLRHPSYQYYPVVGVTWVQANQYCEWRGARINELDSNSDDSVILRLPTELEWEFAALTNYSFNEQTKTNDRDFSVRKKLGFGRGKMMHNFQRGRGDAQGVAHRPNDAAFIPAPVYMFEPNDYGIYNIYGNVAEWVGDVYLPVTIEDVMETVNPGDSLYNIDSLLNDPNFVTPEQAFAEIMDSLGIDDASDTEVETDITGSILRVYKGGSWNDRAYYLNPGARRYLPQNASTDYIGFRCASEIPEDLKKEKREDAVLEPLADEDSTAVEVPDSVQVEKESRRSRKRAEKEAAEEGEEEKEAPAKEEKEKDEEPASEKDKDKEQKAKDKEALKEEKRKAKEKAKADKKAEKERKKKEKENAKAKKEEETEEDE